MPALPIQQSEPRGKRVDGGIALIHDLERGGALTAYQAQRLLASWGALADDWASSPFFRNVGEHSRAYMGQLRKPGIPAAKARSEPQSDFNRSQPSKEAIPHV
jgi:hypothetical protein